MITNPRTLALFMAARSRPELAARDASPRVKALLASPPARVFRRSRRATADLPSDPGGIEPPILTGDYSRSPSNDFTPSITVDPSGPRMGGNLPPGWQQVPDPERTDSDAGPETGRYVDAGPFGGSFAPIPGETWLGGKIVGIDPNTGRPVYDPLGYGQFSDSNTPSTNSYTQGGNGPGVLDIGRGHDAAYWVF